MDTEQKRLNSGFGAETTAEEVAAGFDLTRKVIVVTGGHGGIGLATTRVLSKAGATVIVGARDLGKAQANLAGLRNVDAHLQPRREEAAEFLRRELLGAEIRGGSLKRAAERAKLCVPVEPELGDGTEIAVAAPRLAGVALDEHAKFRRPAGAGL